MKSQTVDTEREKKNHFGQSGGCIIKRYLPSVHGFWLLETKSIKPQHREVISKKRPIRPLSALE
jgi:hypothetical protein